LGIYFQKSFVVFGMLLKTASNWYYSNLFMNPANWSAPDLYMNTSNSNSKIIPYIYEG
jgi:hypothetical protein